MHEPVDQRFVACIAKAAALLVLLGLVVPASGVHGQSRAIQREVFVNSEAERYLRTLQVAGQVPLYPWSSRSFSPAEVDSLLPGNTGHPWAALHDWSRQRTRLRAGLIAPRVELIYNSAFPMGNNDGAVWAGRGLTAAVHAGAVLRYAAFSLVLAPVAFQAENRGFDLAPTGLTGPLQYADPVSPKTIDRPQRFGNSPYARIDLGQSTLLADLPFLAVGISTANLHWGPADQQPLLLGSNAPGFLHAFAMTSVPVNVGIGSLHGRVVWGRLEQSDYTVNPDSMAMRFGTGVVAAFQPRGVGGLEFGLARFFHVQWTDAAPGKLIESFLKQNRADPEENLNGDDGDNQLASIFLRWVLPGTGLEVYAEYGREDHNWNFRDMVMQPDHGAAWTGGFRKVWTPGADRIAVLRGEVMNAEPSHLQHVRHQAPWYIHIGARQGHTHRGQLLGAPAAAGGRASAVTADWYHSAGRWTTAWTREVRRPGTAYGSPDDSRGPDVLHGLGVEAVRSVRHLEILAGVTFARNLNRNRQEDGWNARLVLSGRATP
jgi:hypothetical protein